MILLAHAETDVVDTATNVWDWNSPIALAIFFVGLTTSLVLLVLALKWLAEMPTRRGR